MVSVSYRKALERLWEDRCSITIRVPREDPDTRRTVYDEVVTISDIPCRISFSSISSTDPGVAANVSQTVKLILGNEHNVAAGSKITVNRGGLVRDYAQSGVPAVYDHQQEIMLEIFERWA